RMSGESFDALGTFKVPVVEHGHPAARKVDATPRNENSALAADRADLVVIGNGIAGCIAAMETRQYAPDARILVITEQNHPTINTPALKQFGAGKLELEQLLAYAVGTQQQLGIGMIHQRAVALEPSSHRVRLADGRAIQYRSLLLATGATAARLPVDMPGRDFDGVITLHALSDYLDLRRRLPTVSSAVVIGGGYHAAETAMLLRHRRVKVTWLIRGRGLLPRQLDSAASDLILRQVRRHGVDIQRETEAAGIVGRMGITAGVITTNNTFIPSELVIAAIGTRPDITLAQHTPIEAQPGHGMRVNARLQTSAQDIYVAGAGAAVLDPQTGQYDARGQWYFAVQQGRLAAAAITGVPEAESAAMGAMGNFWHATQFDKLHVLVAGAPMLLEREHRENEVLTNGSGAFYRRVVVRHGHLVGYLAVGANLPPGLSIKRLIDERINIEEIKHKLLAEDFDLRSFFTRRHLHAIETGAVEGVPRPVTSQTLMPIAVWPGQAV
ncbi:MAG TPA: FAD-dependent oxidoreductase, partial [Ktedonobacterales bacterium]|nr:FAD-dependent oxidoreductase [Ktedonobacterales bacterium]